jgi:hypothetical protein
MLHAPFFAEALSDAPELKCANCASVDFHSPDMAPAWANPYAVHLSVDCAICGARNHLLMQWKLGRVIITQRSTHGREL